MAIQQSARDTTNSLLTAVTSGGSAGAKGASYVELIASTSANFSLFTIEVDGSNKTSGIIFIATGAAGAETDILSIPFWQSTTSPLNICIPLTISSGTRLSMNFAAGVSTQTAYAGITLSDQSSFWTSSERTTWGITGAGSGYQGTDIDPGGTANTKATGWTEIVSSTGHDSDLLVVCIGASNNNALLGGSWLVDIATGAGGAESVLIADIFYANDANEIGSVMAVFPAFVASGSRISARCQSTVTDAADRIIDIAIIGVNCTAPAGGTASSRAWASIG